MRNKAVCKAKTTFSHLRTSKWSEFKRTVEIQSKLPFDRKEWLCCWPSMCGCQMSATVLCSKITVSSLFSFNQILIPSSSTWSSRLLTVYFEYDIRYTTQTLRVSDGCALIVILNKCILYFHKWADFTFQAQIRKHIFPSTWSWP